jgi:hypothetical protein
LKDFGITKVWLNSQHGRTEGQPVKY